MLLLAVELRLRLILGLILELGLILGLVPRRFPRHPLGRTPVPTSTPPRTRIPKCLVSSRCRRRQQLRRRTPQPNKRCTTHWRTCSGVHSRRLRLEEQLWALAVCCQCHHHRRRRRRRCQSQWARCRHRSSRPVLRLRFRLRLRLPRLRLLHRMHIGRTRTRTSITRDQSRTKNENHAAARRGTRPAGQPPGPASPSLNPSPTP